MKQKPLFSLNTIQNSNSEVYIVLPEIDNMTFELFSLCLEFTNKYRKTIFLCNEFEISFYKLLINKSKSFEIFKGKISIEMSSISKLKEIQLKDCIIIHLHNDPIVIESLKRAILCFPYEQSDIVFSDTNHEDPLLFLKYIKNLLSFLMIKEQNILKNIELTPNDVITASDITNNLSYKKYNVIILQNMMTYLKVLNALKKSKLKRHLILISKNPIGLTDPKLLTFKSFSLLDIFSFMIQSESIAYEKSSVAKKIIANFRINLSIFSVLKDANAILFDITTKA